MIKELYIKKKDNELYRAYFRYLVREDIEKILEFQDDLFCEIEDEEIYCKTQREEYLNYFKNNDKLLGVFIEDETLIAMGVLARYGCCLGNYGYEIGIKGDCLLKITQIDSVAVKSEFRGNNLQKLICIELEKNCKIDNIEKICATISPKNSYSIKTFVDLGYSIRTEKEMYGGLIRYILVKEVR